MLCDFFMWASHSLTKAVCIILGRCAQESHQRVQFRRQRAALVCGTGLPACLSPQHQLDRPERLSHAASKRSRVTNDICVPTLSVDSAAYTLARASASD